MSKIEKAYSLFMVIFITMIVLTNIIGVKLFEINSVTLTTGIITYPLTFLITDIVCEVFGKKRASLMVVLGFFASILSLVFINLAVMLPGSEVWINNSLGYNSIKDMQNAYESVFTLPGFLISASMLAYLVAQLIDVRIFHYLKKVTNEKKLWLRNNLSTMFSQLIDTIIVNSIFLYFGLNLDWDIIIKIIIASYLFKIIIALLDTPLVYIGVHYTRKYIK
jgi:uncharacterized integral membrane protein (TIGR00697 family)|tara:strand:- start:368 stop:1030 length:663 start_codon:yes stop_codon:yes gene_type:complete